MITTDSNIGSVGAEGKMTGLVHIRARPAGQPYASQPAQLGKKGSEVHVSATVNGNPALALRKRSSGDIPLGEAPMKKAIFMLPPLARTPLC